MTGVRSFTVAYNGTVKTLSSPVRIAAAFDPAALQSGGNTPPLREYIGIWDTGATDSVITQKVVDELGLKPVRMVKVNHAHGTTEAEVYLVNIGLPNHVGFANRHVTKGVLAAVDVLIGMDIIGRGDFAVSNHDGKTTFTFRVPSIKKIDFVEEARAKKAAQMVKVGRNDPCPCGSGKKHKKCCGASSSV